MNYNGYSLQELKGLGHEYLDEYVALDWNKHRNSRDHAYKKLHEKLGRTGFRKHHFSEMDTREEVIEAISKLRKMIKKRKQKIEWIAPEANVKLPQEVLNKIYGR